MSELKNHLKALEVKCTNYDSLIAQIQLILLYTVALSFNLVEFFQKDIAKVPARDTIGDNEEHIGAWGTMARQIKQSFLLQSMH